MYLESIASAFPPHSFSQPDLLEFFTESREMIQTIFEVDDKAYDLGIRILGGESGIDTRYFAIENPFSLLTLDAGALNRMFEEEAPALSVKALKKALDQSCLNATELDALFICTCTGYICPGVTSHVSEMLGMRANAYLSDLVGLGCGAAVPLLRSVHAFLAANPDATVAAVAVESCSSAFFVCSDFGAIISLCLFGDGASASIWKGKSGSTGYRAGDFKTLHLPHHREKIRFINHEGKLRNKLDASVPNLAAKAVHHLYQERTIQTPHILTHTGGRDVLNAIEEACQFSTLLESREVLRKYGNTSSASVMMTLEEHLTRGNLQDHLWLTSFGAGFACHSFEMHR
jgi:predicted naringenin-chalcone synthase